MRNLLSEKRCNAGFNILEMSIGLLLLSLIVLTISPLYRCLLSLQQYDSYFYQDEIGIYQLQIALALGNDVRIEDDSLLYVTAENEMTVSLVNHKIIAQPGTLDFIHDVSDGWFEQQEGIIYVIYKRKGKTYRAPVGYAAQ